ncbi:glycoside hydrolase family 9 protein [Teredinibacter haidensis]|uniref:glycoside hydrolase family 9 protein n=1 Tax=Teredinibacter haidensis TaxID=2731755 RepID=UPI000948A868|nr:glycoside hydrolase family 9 protein [Teredinibacter haidensis]
MKKLYKVLVLLVVSAFVHHVYAVQVSLDENDYFEAQGLNVLVFSNWYNGLFSDAKISGVELIHHGERTATNGDVRLNATPEQWDKIPAFIDRKVNVEAQTIEAFLHYPDYNFKYSIRTTAVDDGVQITVNLPEVLPEALEGHAGFNMEFVPSAYFEKAFLMDNQAGTFPLYPTGAKEQNGTLLPTPLAVGQKLVLAPSDQKSRVSIESSSAALQLFDGRNKAQNGWFVVRSLIPAKEKGDVLQWTLSASVEKNWLRKPVIGHSQVGYHPKQSKVAVIELDARDTKKHPARLLKVSADGHQSTVFKAKPEDWGKYKRYNYRKFDFSSITEPGVYRLQYADVTTAPFLIGENIYTNAWTPTLDMYMPVQMDHMLVNEAYRVWHGASHLDDAVQAPVDLEHFDLYAQGPTTDTPYKPGEHIPGLNIGGWYDAGDFDIRTQSQYRTVMGLVDVWDHFKPTRDTTRVDYARKYVDLHVPDGKADILQQIEHGALALIAQHRAVGHAIPGIIVPKITEYTHLGDGMTMTDNMIYSPGMGELESNGINSGKFDDRWAFTSYSSALNYGSIAGLAAASRALQGYNDELAKECLDTATAAWEKEQNQEPVIFAYGNTTGGSLESEKLNAAVQLLLTTKSKAYAAALEQMQDELEKGFVFQAANAVKVLPFMSDRFKQKVRSLAEGYTQTLAKTEQENPYGVKITEGGWAGNGFVMMGAVNNYYLHKAFPDLVSAESVYSGLNYLYGTHPDSDLSFVSSVGTQSKQVAYGMNRANFSFIAGGIVPGVLILKPDFPENREDWPFMWGQNEYVITMSSSYIFLVHAVEDLLNGE